MPRYVVERLFPNQLTIPVNDEGVTMCRSVAAVNEAEGVFWVHSYVSSDKTKTFCIYDGPSPEAIRRVAHSNKLPVEKITEVHVLDPYFYT